MRVAGIPLGVGQNTIDPILVVLSCSFATDYTDATGRHTLSTITGTPTFSGGSMLIDSTDKVRTGTANGQENTDFDFSTSPFEISCDVKMVDSAEVSIWTHSAYDSETYPSIKVNGSTNVVRVMSYNAIYYLAYTCPFDVKADFFNIKLRKTSESNHELLINDGVVATTAIANLMENSAAINPYSGFRVGQANSVAFNIKNLTVKKYS